MEIQPVSQADPDQYALHAQTPFKHRPLELQSSGHRAGEAKCGIRNIFSSKLILESLNVEKNDPCPCKFEVISLLEQFSPRVDSR